ncbi:trehalose 6-phosphate synthase/phosphatase complex subunit [Maudiozyma humilis]|uniref:Trehalose 6-phosphate synthase/phosphatase complex subunit n=1 Tax=Maudiozyma humilis TaxID=51915 RepID=A0AAV5S3V6_MAUHU|nr:trehalose 6-phosphate synthase/phosphatase complex subunit [Kazachstania humilis]
MTLIVASLFLPFSPQFEVDATSGLEAAELADSNLVKVASETDGKGRKRTSSVHSNTPFSMNSGSMRMSPVGTVDEALLDETSGAVTVTDDQGVIDEALEEDKPVITPDQLLENLTNPASAANMATQGGSAGLPGSASSANLAAIGNENVGGGSDEEFFNVAAQQQQLPQQNGLGDNYEGRARSSDSLARFTSNSPNESVTSLLSLASGGRPVVHSAVGTGHSASMTPTTGTIVTPKSRTVPDYNAAVVDVSKIKEKHNEMYSSLPSMKRTSFSKNGQRRKSEIHELLHSLPSSGLGPSRTIDETARFEENDDTNVSDDDDSDTNIDEDEDSDLESDTRQTYNVPKFGGYSSLSKAKINLRQSHEIFSQIPWKIVPSQKGNGAMKNAINIASAEKTIHDPVRWVGTVGIPTDEIPTGIANNITDTLRDEYNSTAVITDDITFKGAYKNFCKQILWPTLHYIIPDNPNSKAFEDHSWNYYQKLNQQFANKIVETYKDGDTIWIQDYHLMLVPAMVRKQLPKAKIGFYLHVSFPSSEVFRVFAHREEILEGIIGANSVGFQNKEYARHFLQTANRLIMADVSPEELKYNGQIVSITHTPVGIDFFTLNNELENENVKQWRQMIRNRWQGKQLIVCRDQFDSIRGIDRKMLAYERFLNDNPEFIDKIVLIQICLSKYESVELERQVMVIVDRINSMSSNISSSQPVVILHQEITFPQYLALSAEADLFLISSLREGMNLTCHEFVVCSEEKNAPLLLSEFTGSASVLKEGSILINPWDTVQMARSIKRALDMPRDEKRRDWKKLMKSVINNDSDNWISSSLGKINAAWEFNEERSTVFSLSHSALSADYKRTSNHLFIFKISDPPNSRTLAMLNELGSKNTVFVLSHLSKATVESLYSRVVNIGLIVENGAYVKIDGTWHNIVQHIDWMKEVMKILDDKIERLPGSYYKVADSMVRFHTENVEDKDRISAVVGEAITHINTLYDKKGIHAHIYKNIVFVQEIGLSVKALRFIFRYYNNSSNVSKSPMKTYGGMPSFNEQIEFACITGSSSPIIEPLFKRINDKVNEGTLRVGYSIVYGDPTSTYAKEHVSGLNELFTLVSAVSK